ncbi:hypothetical protein ACFYWN_46345, partial [Streptomyces sp. NPDC002917]
MEALAEQQAPSRAPKGRELGDQGEGQQQGAAWQGVSGPARALLKFSTPRDPATLAAFISLRVLNPEHQHWRRGIEAATIYHRLHDDLRVPFTYRVPHGKETGGAESGAPGSAARERPGTEAAAGAGTGTGAAAGTAAGAGAAAGTGTTA